jgi:hypothetical protein
MRSGRWTNFIAIAALLPVLALGQRSPGDEPVRADRAFETQGIAALITGPRQPLQDLIISGGSGAEIRLVPKVAHPSGAYNTGGYYTQGSISGQRLTVCGAGRTYWNVQLSNWGDDGNGLRSWQGRIAPSSLLGTSADCGGGPGSCPGAGNLAPAMVSCTTSANCTAAFGEAKQISTSTCAQDPHCRASSPPFSGNNCEAAYVNDTRPDWIFQSLVNPTSLCFATSGPPIINVSLLFFGTYFGEMADGGLNYYGGTLVIDVPANARGLYRLEWLPDETFYADFENVGYYLSLFPGELMVLEPCTCNGNVNGDGFVNANDEIVVGTCIRQGNCSGCVNTCDVNCDGLIDWVDFGLVRCQWNGATDCCERPTGACYDFSYAGSAEFCVTTLPTACTAYGGSYAGDNTSCPINNCACDADVDNNGFTNIVDVARILDCARGVSCSACSGGCDVDCDGNVDFADAGAAWCEFQGGGSYCCNEAIGACNTSNPLYPPCLLTTERACEDPLLFAGTYLGDNSTCSDVCSVPGDPACGASEFCNFPIGTCGTPPDGGLCEVRPTECPLALWDPVCGCDGVTYAYDCFAYKAGVSIDYWGECGSPVCFATRSFGDTTYCPGDVDSVTIDLTPPLGTDALAVEDSPPPGWSVGAISNGGFYDAANHKVKWGPFFAPIPAQVSYELTPVGTGIQCFSGTVSVDGDNSAVCGDPCEEEMCCDHMAAETAAGDCAACAVGNCAECSTGACEDGSISLCEVISYACAWMRGCNDDIGAMTRAAYIWHNGECYCWDAGADNWVSTACGGGSICCAAGRSTAAATPSVPVGFSSLEVSPIGDSSQWLVTVQLAPAPGTSASAVELVVPKRWRVTSVDGGGQHDSTFGKIKWGPFFEDTPRTLSATLEGPSTRSLDIARASSGRRTRLDSPSGPGIKGTVSFDGINQPLGLKD